MRARNMQSLTDAVKHRYPGVVIYGIGNEAHQDHPSDHNEDDTPGSRPAQSDPDSNPEHRAIDIMLGSAFTKAQAYVLIAALLADPAARARLKYIIFDGWIWSRSNGWTKTAFTDDPHRDHIHISGLASDDENAAGWPAIDKGGVSTLFCKEKDSGENVKPLQVRLTNLGFNPGAIDGSYGPAVRAALRAACVKVSPTTKADGSSYNAYTMFYVDVLMARKYSTPGIPGKDGADGKDGVDGKPGRDGMLILPEKVTIEATVRPA